MGDPVFVANGISYPKVYPGVYEIPHTALGDLRIGQLLPHSSVYVVDLPSPPPDYDEFYLNITHGGDEGEDQYLSIFGSVHFNPEKHREIKSARLRRAFMPMVERGELPDPFIPPSTKDRPNNGVSFSIDVAGRPDAIILEEIQPLLQFFNRISAPDRKVFICHASEDKPSARTIGLHLRQAGAKVWLDEWEIKVGDSIVEKINDGLSEATHLLLLLSTTSVEKPWVKKEFSSALMRQLSDKSISVLPILIDSCNIPIIFADILYADFRANDAVALAQVSNAIFQTSTSDFAE